LPASLSSVLFAHRWALYDIARHPEVQKRIAKELADAGLLQVSVRVCLQTSPNFKNQNLELAGCTVFTWKSDGATRLGLGASGRTWQGQPYKMRALCESRLETGVADFQFWTSGIYLDWNLIF
jgi:hypothetical protein